MKIDIFDYTEYHRYLKDYYTENKGTSPAVFSYTSLARKGGFLNEGIVFNIFSNTNTVLTLGHCIRLSKALEHSDEEAEYFRCLVALSQANHEEEVQYFKKMRKRISERHDVTTGMVGKNREEFYGEWYHSVVRAMIGMSDIYDNVNEQLGKKLLPPVTEIQIKQSVELLFRLGFIKKDGNGNYLIATEKNIKTGQEFSSQEKKRIHLQYLKLANDVLSMNCIEPEKVSSHVLGISGKTYEKICTHTDELKKKIDMLVENEEKSDRVYLYQLIFVPLTRDCSID